MSVLKTITDLWGNKILRTEDSATIQKFERDMEDKLDEMWQNPQTVICQWLIKQLPNYKRLFSEYDEFTKELQFTIYPYRFIIQNLDAKKPPEKEKSEVIVTASTDYSTPVE